MISSRVPSVTRSRLASAALATVFTAALACTFPAHAAEPVPPLYDGKNTTYNILPGSILRTGDSFLSGIVSTIGLKTPTIQGNGTCSQGACPVLFNGQTVYARRSRLRLPETAGMKAGSTPPVIGILGGQSFRVNQTLRRGDMGEDVLHLQEALNKNGAAMVIDKNYGRGTREAVRAFQRAKGIEADGVAGPATLRALGLWGN